MRFPAATLSISALSLLVAAGCSAAPGIDGALGDNENPIVDVPHTDVERQSIGNCWIYAHATWAESMNKAATGRDFDISQSYWTYWHWFDQIANAGTPKRTNNRANGLREAKRMSRLRRNGSNREPFAVDCDGCIGRWGCPAVFIIPFGRSNGLSRLEQ